MSISVMTVVRGRQTHLDNQRAGFIGSELQPDEWIVIGMGQDIQIPPLPGVRLVTDRVEYDGENLPLAEARNRAAEICLNEKMVFLDVDCIPSRRMLTFFDKVLTESPQLWMGNALYLTSEATIGQWQTEDLRRDAVQHPLLPELGDGERLAASKYERFWSLCFGITKTDFAKIGGFDPRFDGYGGEDTDFALQARDADVEFGFVGATAYHQHHSVCKPPLNHFASIVRNAETFLKKWNVWPMESWLVQFAEQGLIDFTPDKNNLKVLRHPSSKEIEQATFSSPAGF